jgi:hypothetical protein
VKNLFKTQCKNNTKSNTYSNYTRKIGQVSFECPACMFYYEECTQTIATTIIMYIERRIARLTLWNIPLILKSQVGGWKYYSVASI